MDINRLYEEIGETCPFKLARELGVQVEHNYFNVDAWCGGYMYNEDLEKYYIIINTKIDADTQEAACHLLVQQHLLHQGIDLSVSVDDIRRLNRADKAARKYLKVVTEAFLRITKVTQEA